MQKIDRLGWTVGLSFTAYGTRFGLRVNDSAVLAQVTDYLPPGWTLSATAEADFLYSLLSGRPSRDKGRRNYHLLYAGATQLARTLELDQLFARLQAHLELLTAYLAKDCLFVHAGVVGWAGQAIVIPGRSFSGKTTLVKALVEAGATYYSDEFTILDPQGQVQPYPVPLAIRDESGRNPQKYFVEALGGQVGTEPLPVGLVVVTEYRPGARWQPRLLTPGRAMLALMDNTVAARRGAEISMPILKQVATRATTLKSKRGEASQIIAPLLNLVQPNSFEECRSYVLSPKIS